MDATNIISSIVFGAFFLIVGGYIFLKLIGRIVHYNPDTPIVKPDPNVSVERVRMLTVDLHLHPKILHPFGNQFNNERAIEIVNYLKNYDIVAVNEAHSSPFHSISAFAKKMKDAGYIYSTGLPNVDIASVAVADGGVIIFSKLPILKHDNILFNLCCGQDYLLSKGSVYARVQTSPTEYIHVVATNLQSLSDNSIPECQAVRMNQIRETQRLISRNRQDQFPVFVLGNFNIDSINPITAGKLSKNEYERLCRSFTVDKCQFLDMLYDSQGEHKPTYGAGDKIITDKRDINKHMSTDYVIAFNPLEGPLYMSNHITDVVRLESTSKQFNYCSSHFGVEAEIVLSHRAPEA